MAQRQPISQQVKRVPPALLDAAKRVLERSVPNSAIRHSLYIEKSEPFLSTEKMVLIANEGRTDPGYICFFPQQPIMFINSRVDQGVFLRLRVDTSLFQGTVFIGTLDGGNLVFEDCYAWRGKSVADQSFSKRFALLNTFFHTLCVRDERISGVKIHLAKLHALAELPVLIQKDEYWSIDFVPEAPQRRRFFHKLHIQGQGQLQRPMQIQGQVQPATTAKPVIEEKPTQLVAIAKNIQGLPDTYDLFSYDKVHIGEAAIQSDQMSTQVRLAIQKNSSLPVFVDWNEEFECYEISGIPVEKVLIHKAYLFKIALVPNAVATTAAAAAATNVAAKTAEVARRPVQKSREVAHSGVWLGTEED